MHRKVPIASAAIALLALVASLAPAAAQQTASFCSTPNAAIPDNNSTGFTDTLGVTENLNILDLDVYILANHTWVGDLQFILSNGATTVTLVDRPGNPTTTFGCSGDNYDVTVDDEGPDTAIENQCGAVAPAITGVAPGGDPPNTSLLAAYDGQSASGSWTLTAIDNAGGDTGTLLEWCLEMTLEERPSVLEIPTLGTVGASLLGLALAGLGLGTLRRRRG